MFDTPTTVYGFYDDCMTKYPGHGQAVWEEFNSVFDYLPLTGWALSSVFCVLGGGGGGGKNGRKNFFFIF